MFFSRSENEIQSVYGYKRKSVDALIAKGFLKRNVKYFLKNIPSFVRNRHSSYLPLFKNYKYAYFNGSVYVDCFAPKWPGNAFDRVTDVLLRNYQAQPENWEPFTAGLVISITKKCVYRCEHCYAINTLGSSDILSLEALLHIAKCFQKIGVGIIAWEGGEPLMRFDELLTLIRETKDESDAWLATTAYGLDGEKARRLKEAGLTAAIISLDHYLPDKHNEFRRNIKAFDMAVNGARLFRENGILPNFCICATKEIMAEDGLYRYLELAKDVGVAFVQILDATPSGNYLGKDVMLSHEQLEEIKKFHVAMNTDPRYNDYPGVSARALLEDDSFYGCCAGNGLCYVDSSGNLQACDLLQISFGNVLQDGVESAYHTMKKHFRYPVGGRCPAQTLHHDILEVYNSSKTLPLPYENSQLILAKIGKRGLPRRLREKVH